MICFECRTKGDKSTVRSTGGASTAMFADDFWDAEGVHHIHDNNSTTWGYRCSLGHNWSETIMKRCPVDDCEWNGVTVDG